MFATLFKHAQASVGNAIGQVVNRVIIAIPFLVALGFATAALYLRLELTHGAETASLILAGTFVLAGTATLLVFGRAPEAGQVSGHEAQPAEQASPDIEAETLNRTAQEMSQADRELLMAALSSAAPIALPAIVRGLLRNLPLVAVIVAALIVFLSDSAKHNKAQPTAPGTQPTL